VVVLDVVARHVVVTGLMGSGKSTVGQQVAAHLDRPWSDSDSVIEAAELRTGRQIAVFEGVPKLHEMEATHLQETLAETRWLVIGAAPSVLDNAGCRDQLQRLAITVFLDVDPTLLVERQGSSEHRRVLTTPLSTLVRMRSLRRMAMAEIGGMVIDCGEASPAELASRIVDQLRSGQR